ncbi:MAG: methylated-DNA--[protein]-cysteine S-methyltransferase [Rhodospirillaceae bacterium]|nr:MAG: methylated-DNA--[protein]-cysteine S-methyltransferase [Rhodospirillaceae bacterium]
MPQLSLHTPVGDLTISAEDERIVAVDWGWGRDQAPTKILREAKKQLEAYFDGKLKRFDLPLAPAGTLFQQQVWRAMCDIPYGGTATYGALAARLHSSARSVGTACGRNPLPILIPCHRVVAAGNRLGGYSGDGGMKTKTALLRLEGSEIFTP